MEEAGCGFPQRPWAWERGKALVLPFWELWGGFSHRPLMSLPAFIALNPALSGAIAPWAILGQLLGLVGGEAPEKEPFSSDLPCHLRSPCHLSVQVG